MEDGACFGSRPARAPPVLDPPLVLSVIAPRVQVLGSAALRARRRGGLRCVSAWTHVPTSGRPPRSGSPVLRLSPRCLVRPLVAALECRPTTSATLSALTDRVALRMATPPLTTAIHAPAIVAHRVVLAVVAHRVALGVVYWTALVVVVAVAAVAAHQVAMAGRAPVTTAHHHVDTAAHPSATGTRALATAVRRPGNLATAAAAATAGTAATAAPPRHARRSTVLEGWWGRCAGRGAPGYRTFASAHARASTSTTSARLGPTSRWCASRAATSRCAEQSRWSPRR